jgi:hypothetical protein
MNYSGDLLRRDALSCGDELFKPSEIRRIDGFVRYAIRLARVLDSASNSSIAV